MGVGSGVGVLEREREVVEVYAGGRGRSVLIESLPEATLTELVNGFRAAELVELTIVINRVNGCRLNSQLQLSFGGSVKLLVDGWVRWVKRDVTCSTVRVPFEKDFLVGRKCKQSSELHHVSVIRAVSQLPKGQAGKTRARSNKNREFQYLVRKNIGTKISQGKFEATGLVIDRDLRSDQSIRCKSAVTGHDDEGPSRGITDELRALH